MPGSASGSAKILRWKPGIPPRLDTTFLKMTKIVFWLKGLYKQSVVSGGALKRSETVETCRGKELCNKCRGDEIFSPLPMVSFLACKILEKKKI